MGRGRRMLKIQQYKRKTHGFRTFSCFGPHVWNSLPQDLRLHCSTLSSFTAKLKTFLFSQYFHPDSYQYPVSHCVCVCVCARACACVASSSHSIFIPTSNISTQFLIVCACVCLFFRIILHVNCFGRTVLYTKL